LPYWLLPIIAAPFIGSFLGTVVIRLPEGRAISLGRSTCDRCGMILKVRDLVPVLSWASTGARCRYCGGRLGWFYPGIELAAVAVAALAAAVDGADPVRLWLDCLLGWALLTVSWIDADRSELPDIITLPLILIGLADTAWERPETLTDHALAAAIGYGLFRLVSLGYRGLRGREGLGEGDAKLVAAGGAWLGVYSLSWLIALAALAGLATAGIAMAAGARLNRESAIPFGPFLALAIFALRLYDVGSIAVL
jgi:leader peptidase (prepilin peptidase) / N-methyltransferase